MDSTSRTDAETLLLRASQAYDIPCRRDEIRSALDDPVLGPSFAKWAAERLPEDFLLTIDELSLYTALDASGHVDALAGMHDLAEVQAVKEEDVKSAVEQLKRTTERINKQTQTLRQQQDALAKLLKKSSENDARRREMETRWRTSAESEQKRIAAEVEELTSSIAFRLSDLEQHRQDRTSALKGTVEAIFQKDDKTLGSLQKLGRELHHETPEEPQRVDELRDICTRLMKLSIESFRTRLDTVYMDTLVSASQSKQSVSSLPDAQVNALEEEVESLYSEILPVAQMSIEQQYLEPALRALDENGARRIQQSVSVTTYMNECLDVVLDHMQRLKQRVQDHKSHQVAASTMISIANQEMQTIELVPAPQSSFPPTVPMSPIRAPSRSHARSHSRSHSRHKSVPSTPGELSSSATPLESLLSSLAISLPYSSSAGHGAQIRAISEILSDRARKTQDVSRNAQESLESNFMAHLEDMKTAVQLLRDSVMAESPFGEVKLVDGDIKESIEVLEQEAEKLQQGLERLSAERNQMSKSEKKEEMLRRWG